MSGTELPGSPFAGLLDLAAGAEIRVLPRDEIDRILADHRLYLETERRQGRRADFTVVDLSGRVFAGVDLRRATLPRAPHAGEPDWRAVETRLFAPGRSVARAAERGQSHRGRPRGRLARGRGHGIFPHGWGCARSRTGPGRGYERRR